MSLLVMFANVTGLWKEKSESKQPLNCWDKPWKQVSIY